MTRLLARIATCALVAATGVWAVRDYRRWLALGPGGLPATPVGWLTTTALRVRGGDRFHVRAAVGAVGELPPDLPARRVPRPRVAPHPIPHRVLEQHATGEVLSDTQAVFDGLVEARPSTVEYRTSRWEKHHDALWLRDDRDSGPGGRPGAGEIAHLHPGDGSMHVVLGAADAQLVVDRGWGELHPLAGRAGGLPATYVLLYPPASRQDVDTVRLILAAAVASARRDES